MSAQESAFVAPESDPHYPTSKHRPTPSHILILKDMPQISQIELILVQKYEPEAAELTETRKAGEVVVREIKFDKIDAEG